MPPTHAAFSVLDWAVLGGYFLILVAIGAVASRRSSKGGADDYFLAGRQMPVWAVAASVLATATSAATFIGAPEEAYKGDLTYLSTNIGTVLAVVIVACLFIPAFYRHNVTTVYDLLEQRFDYRAKVAASWAFMIGRVFASGSRVFAAALPASLILFGDTRADHLVMAIGVLMVAGILTALGGGIRTVIWTDCLQVCVFLLAAGAALWVLLSRIPIGAGEIVSVLNDAQVGGASKLTVIKPGIDPSRPGLGFRLGDTYTLLTAVFGFSLLNLAAYGTDHDLTQRMLTCRSAIKGGSSAFLALALNIPMVAVFMSIGLLLYIFYQRADVMGAAAPGYVPEKSAEVFLRFILHEMPTGVKGLMLAGLFAVGVGSLNSALAAMAATFVNDTYKRARPGLTDVAYVRAGRWATVAWGVVLGGFACLCVAWFARGGAETLIRFVLNAMTFVYAGLLGVFLTALCTKRGNATSAIAALATGFVVVLAAQPVVWPFWTGGFVRELMPFLPEKTPAPFPWNMTFATAIAFAVCAAGAPRRRAEAWGT